MVKVNACIQLVVQLTSIGLRFVPFFRDSHFSEVLRGFVRLRGWSGEGLRVLRNSRGSGF